MIHMQLIVYNPFMYLLCRSAYKENVTEKYFSYQIGHSSVFKIAPIVLTVSSITAIPIFHSIQSTKTEKL